MLVSDKVLYLSISNASQGLGIYEQEKKANAEEDTKSSHAWLNLYAKDSEPVSNLPFKIIGQKWLESIRYKVKESTYARYNYVVFRYVFPYIGTIPFVNLNASIIDEYANQLLAKGKIENSGGLSGKSVTDILSIVKQIIKYAHIYIDNDNLHLDNLRIKQTSKKMRVLSRCEERDLTKYLMANMDYMNFGILLSLYSGIRLGELCALKWENINEQTGILEIRKTILRIQNTEPYAVSKTKVIISSPKSQCSMRDIPLPESILQIVRKIKASPTSYILSGLPQKYVEPRTMQNYFQRVLIEAQVSHANFHALRHTFATRCVELGFEIKSLSEILGHSNVNITLNRYVHSSLEQKQENMNKIDHFFNLSAI